MNRKFTTIIAGTVLIFTNFSLPVSALKSDKDFISNNLENSQSEDNTELKISELENKNENILIARKRRKDREEREREWEKERRRWEKRRREDLEKRRERRWETDVRGARDRDWDRYDNRNWERDIRVPRRRGRNEYEYRRDRRSRRNEIRHLREVERICRYQRPPGRRWRKRCRQIRRRYRR